MSYPRNKQEWDSCLLSTKEDESKISSRQKLIQEIVDDVNALDEEKDFYVNLHISPDSDLGGDAYVRHFKQIDIGEFSLSNILGIELKGFKNLGRK